MTQIKNDLSKKYSLATRIVHWLTALGIFILIPLGLKMSEMEISTDKLALYKTHNIIGFIILLLTLFRVFLYFKHERPTTIQTGSKWNDKLAVWIHNTFYFVIILMVSSGIATNISTGIFDAISSNDVSQFPTIIDGKPAQVHQTLYLVLAVMIIMHSAGFLKHWILKKENTFNRIF